MNDYRDFLPFLHREIALLEQPPFELTFHQIHRVLAGEFAAQTDAVLDEYIPELAWPQLEDPIRFELCLRLSCAVYWINELQPDFQTDENLQDLLYSLVKDYWPDGGRNRWLWDHYFHADYKWT